MTQRLCRKGIQRKIAVLIAVALFAAIFSGGGIVNEGRAAKAASGKVIKLGKKGKNGVSIKFGTTGTFQIDKTSADSIFAPYADQITEVRYYLGTSAGSYYDDDDYDDDDKAIFSLDRKSGEFKAQGLGKTSVTVVAYGKRPQPEESPEPEETYMPEVSAEPEETYMPGYSDEPEETYMPGNSTWPEETFMPGYSAEPENTFVPEYSHAPYYDEYYDDSYDDYYNYFYNLYNKNYQKKYRYYYDDEYDTVVELIQHTYSVNITLSMKNVTLSKNSFHSASVSSNGSSYEYDYRYWDSTPSQTFVSKVKGISGVDQDTPGIDFDVSYSNRKLSIETEFYQGKLTFDVSGYGKTKATIKIHGKKFKVTFDIKEIKMLGDTSLYLKKGKMKQLKVKNASLVKWKSTNKKILSVTKKGKIKAKKIGTAVVLGKAKGGYIGCVVSVVTPKRLQVIKRGRYIGTNWTYSQSKRMQNKYYDCSALVWKSYKYEHKGFGSNSYAPVAADVAKYCADHKKLVNGNAEKNIQNMKYQPGALTFKTGVNNGRYKGIYHVEMFIGYTLEWIDSDGKPYLGTKWAAREDNYGYGEIWAQP